LNRLYKHYELRYSPVEAIEDRDVKTKTWWKRAARWIMKTLHLHFIHHFAVKSALAGCAIVSTNSRFEYPESCDDGKDQLLRH
jgi:hypothetical protein